MQKQNRASSLKSSFHRRSQNYLIAYMVKQVGLSEQIAHVLICCHNCISLAEAFDLFVKNQNGLYNHIFISSQKSPEICQVCQTRSEQHQFIDQIAVKEAKAIFKQIEGNQMQEDKLSESILDQFTSSKSQKSQQTRQTCQICYIQYLNSDLALISDKIHQVCLQCMNSYIKQEIGNMRVDSISCPHCGEKLNPQTIKEFVDNVSYNKYKIFLRNVEIQKNPHLKWCPNPKCSIVIMANDKKKTTKCPKCAVQICNKCNREAHPRSSCNSVFKNQIKDWENSSDIQKCKKCKGMVEKVSGCNHMTCSVCGYEWCWLCGASYSPTHFNPLNPFGCPGLQDRQRQDWGKCRIICWRILLFLGIVISIPIILPLAMIACGPVFFGHFLWNECYPYSCFKKAILVLISAIVGLVIDPFVWIGVLVIYIPKAVIYCYDYFKRRREINQYNDSMLKSKLIREAENVYDQNQIMA